MSKNTVPLPKSKEKSKGPKRPTSVYFFYTSVRRVIIKETVPTLSTTEISKIIGAEWKELNDSVKAVYIDMAVRDKERYERPKKQFEETGSWSEDFGSSTQQNQAVKRKPEIMKQVPNKRVSKK